MPAPAAFALLLAATAAFDPAPLDRCLGRHVREGLVDYQALRRDPDFARYRAQLAKAEAPDGASREERLAFWINAYNAAALMGVIDHLPLRSVLEFGPAGGSAFFRTLRFRIAGVDRTLDEMENGILRPQFGDPRIHFALVCAARGCPPLRAAAWQAGTIDADLDAAARQFVSDARKVSLQEKEGVLRLSPIFQWYASDFDAAGGVVAWLKRYATFPVPSDVRVEYLDYSWELNEAPRSPASGGVIDSAP